MNKIISIEQLLNHLEKCTRDELDNICPLLEIPLKEFEPYLYWSKNRYTRNCIIKTDDYELLVMCWGKDHYSAIHSHDEQECWFYTVSGKFREDIYELDHNQKLIKLKTATLKEEEHCYMTDNMGFHDIHNVNDGESISLHLYAKPMNQCNVYCNKSDSFEFKNLNFDSIGGKTTSYFQN